MTDKFHGHGGSFEIRNGERVQIEKPGAPHKDGDRARHVDGKPVDAPAPDPNESALPKPGPAPWAAPAAAASVEPAPRSKKGE